MVFTNLRVIHKHVSLQHQTAVEHLRESLLKSTDDVDNDSSESPSKRLNLDESACLPLRFTDEDEFKWLPKYECSPASDSHIPGRVLLFYHYRWLPDTEHVKNWQAALCSRLHLTGKVRVAEEGLNVTVAGSHDATEIYMEAVLKHPFFTGMTRQDFKTSPGGAADFPGGLKVGIYAEVCPMGVNPKTLPFSNGGKHVTPEEFHEAVSSHVTGNDSDTLFVDCRNFYESKIGAFSGAMRPDIRKFSYWPEYIDKNQEFFRDKTVYMYCTGGIRCERGSAYLRDKGVCKDVLQLSGGIHKYMEQYPDGHFRGKLFVFDNRYAIKSNDDVIAKCTYCSAPWDQYQPCTSAHCHQLVLSCTQCRTRDLTACCRLCQQHADEGRRREECECTRARDRIPMETLPEAVPSNGDRSGAEVNGDEKPNMTGDNYQGERTMPSDECGEKEAETPSIDRDEDKCKRTVPGGVCGENEAEKPSSCGDGHIDDRTVHSEVCEDKPESGKTS